MFKTIASGNLTADPMLYTRKKVTERADPETGEIIRKETEVKVCNFSLAAESGTGAYKTTTFVKVVAWRELGEICAKCLTKGRGVLVEGLLSLNSYVGKDKTVHNILELRADSVEFLKDGRKVTDTEMQEMIPAGDPDEEDGIY